MKEILKIIEKIINHKLFLLIIGIVLIVFSAINDIELENVNISLDIYGRLILFFLGFFLIIFSIVKNKSYNFGISKKIKPLFIDKPIKITSSNNNKYKIKSDFIFWNNCTIMLWVYVTPKNEALRNSKSNRYLFAYHTGTVEPKNIHTSFFNQFTLRHNSINNEWNIGISDNSANYIPKTSLKDTLDEGWHHFIISWSKKEDILNFAIHDLKGKLQSQEYFPDRFKHWTEKINVKEKVTVGAFQSSYSNHYCETKLFNLEIINSYIDIDGKEFKEHISKKPIAF